MLASDEYQDFECDLSVPGRFLVGIPVRHRIEDSTFPLGERHQESCVFVRPLDEH